MRQNLAETMYAQASAQTQESAEGAEPAGDSKKDEDVVDADFEEVKK